MYRHCLGKGMVRACARRRVDSGKLYRCGCGWDTISFTAIVKEDGIRRRGMCYVCLEAEDRIKAENSGTVHI